MLTVFNDSDCHSKRGQEADKVLKTLFMGLLYRSTNGIFLPRKCHLLLINDSETLTIINNCISQIMPGKGTSIFQRYKHFESIKIPYFWKGALSFIYQQTPTKLLVRNKRGTY